MYFLPRTQRYAISKVESYVQKRYARRKRKVCSSRSLTFESLEIRTLLCAHDFNDPGIPEDNEPVDDTTAPIITVNSLLSDDATPELSGTVDDPTASICVTIDRNEYRADNNRDGTWTLPNDLIEPPLPDGIVAIVATARDEAGNEGSDRNELIVRERPLITVNASVTSDTSPLLTGTVADNSGAADVRIYVFVDGRLNLANNNGDGTWTLPDNLIAPPLRERMYSVVAFALDAANEFDVDFTTLVIDLTPPSVTVNRLQTRDATPTLTGTVDDPLATVSVSIAGRDFQANNDGNGSWTLPGDTFDIPLPDGAFDIVVTATDAAGNIGRDTSTSELFVREPPIITVDSITTNDSTPQLTGTVSDNSPLERIRVYVIVNRNIYLADNVGNGVWILPDNAIDPALGEGAWEVLAFAVDDVSFGVDATTNEVVIDVTAPTISVTTTATTDATPELAGEIDDPTAEIAVKVGESLYAATNHGDGTWTLSDNSNSPALSDETHEIIASAKDLAGNETSTIAQLSVNQPPTITVDALTTSDQTPELSGTVTDNGNLNELFILLVVDGRGYLASNNGDGTWQLADDTLITPLQSGTHQVVAVAIDRSFNVSFDTTRDELVIVEAGPLVTVSVLSTNDQTPQLTGTVVDPSAPITVTVVDTSYEATNLGDGSWVLPDDVISPPLAPGNYDVMVIAIDSQDNAITDETEGELTIDVVGPAGQVSILRDDSSNGEDETLSDDMVTNDTTPQLEVTFTEPVFGEPSDVTVFDPLRNPIMPDMVTGIGSDTLVIRFDAPLVEEGQYFVRLSATETITDEAGNALNQIFDPDDELNSGVDEVISFHIDTTPPNSMMNAVTTNDTRPGITGTIDDAEARIQVTINEAEYVATNHADGTWTIPANTVTELQAGRYEASLVATDIAGNSAAISISNAINIVSGRMPGDPPDTNGQPGATVAVGVHELTTRDSTPRLSGNLDGEGISSVTVKIQGRTHRARRLNNMWELADNKLATLSDGIYDVEVTARIPGGYVRDITADEVRIDTTPPVVTVQSQVTLDTTPALTGSVNDGQFDPMEVEVKVTIDSVTYNADVDDNGKWTIDDNRIAELKKGIYNVVVTATDKAGNVGVDATTDEVAVDPFINERVFAGSSPPVTGSKGVLTLPRDPAANEFLHWEVPLDGAFLPGFSTIDAGQVRIDSWRVIGQNPTRVVFAGCHDDENEVVNPCNDHDIGQNRIHFQGNVLLEPQNHGVLDVATSNGRVRYLLLAGASIDLDIDSDNDDGFMVPQRTPFEDVIEDAGGSEVEPFGKRLLLNTDDGDRDGVPDFADGYNLNPMDGNDDSPPSSVQGEQFVPLVVELPETVNLAEATMTISYSASDPGAVLLPDSRATNDYTLPQGHLRLWTADGPATRTARSAVTRGGNEGTLGFYVPPGVYRGRDFANLGFTEDGRIVTLYVEGVRLADNIDDRSVRIEVDRDGPDGPAEVTALDIDAVLVATIPNGPLYTTDENREPIGEPGASVFLHNGASNVRAVDLEIPGRGFDWRFERTYRSDVDFSGPLGHNWDHNYNRRLWIADVRNLAAVHRTFPDAKIGDIVHLDGFNRADLYVCIVKTPADENVPVGENVPASENGCTAENVDTYAPPAGFYTELKRNVDEEGKITFAERYGDGTIVSYAAPDVSGYASITSLTDRNDNEMTFLYNDAGQLIHVVDTMGRNIDYTYNAEGLLTDVTDFFDRSIKFTYENGDLAAVTSPKVNGTPTGNDFPDGKTVRYTYSSSMGDPLLEHDLLTLTAPNEVATQPEVEVKAGKRARVVFSYDTNPGSPDVGRVTSQTIGGQNASGVPAGGTIRFAYQTTVMEPDRDEFGTVVRQTSVTDPNGNRSEYKFNALNNMLIATEFTNRGVRGDGEEDYTTRYTYNGDYELLGVIHPEGNSSTFEYDTRADTPRFQQGNLIRELRDPGSRRGDQEQLESVYVYEPIYNQLFLSVSARGSNVANNDFEPPIPDVTSRVIVDPYNSDRALDLRYATVNFFDYQESFDPAILSEDPQIAESPVVAADRSVLTSEILLLRELGLPEDKAGLTELRRRLAFNDEIDIVRLRLGDLNADQQTTSVSGNVVRIVTGSPVLIQNSNQHSIETRIDPPDLVDERGELFEGQPGERGEGGPDSNIAGRLQTIVSFSQYNKFGQPTKLIDAEGNVTTYEYFAENDPDGDMLTTPQFPDSRTLDAETGGYLGRIVEDDLREYSADNGSRFSNNALDPTPAEISSSYQYDKVGNVTATINPRGIRTEYFVNELNQVVQVVSAADIEEAKQADPSDPLATASDKANPSDPPATASDAEKLVAFEYLTRYFYDFNDNVLLTQIEDRGNTSNVEGLGVTPPQYATNTTPGLASAELPQPKQKDTAFVDSLQLYDILDNPIESRIEVDRTRSINTRYRYDPNGNQVLMIYPEGNAEAWVYDERDLLFQTTRGASARPSNGLYATRDPENFNRPGGARTEPSTFTYNYDGNQNLSESVDAVDTDGNISNNSQISGIGDVTTFQYDGFDRQKSVTDPLGNQTLYTYDPDDNVVRVIHRGDPIDDVVGADENRTLAVTESVYDELNRVVATHQVLFHTPGVVPTRPVTLTDTSAMDSLAPYLTGLGQQGDEMFVPGAEDIQVVIGRVSTITEYDRLSRPTFTVQDDLDTYRTSYDGAGRAIQSTDSAKSNGDIGDESVKFDPRRLDGNTVSIAYDDNNNVIEQLETDVSVAFIGSEQFVTTFLYDSLDRLQTSISNTVHDDVGAYATDYRYDSRGNLVATADAQGPFDEEQRRTFERRGLGSSEVVAVNLYGNIKRRRFDGVNRLLVTETVLSDGGTGHGDYIGADIYGMEKEIPSGNKLSIRAADGLISTYYAYDDNSQLIGLRDDNGNTTAYFYDNQDRQLVERKGLGVLDTEINVKENDRRVVRDVDDNVLNVPNRIGEFSVKLRGGYMPTGSRDDSSDTRLGYDRDGNVAVRVDEAGNRFVYGYDGLNRRKSLDISRTSLFVGTGKQTFQFDGLSRINATSDDNGVGLDVTTEHKFDSLSREVEETLTIAGQPKRATIRHFDIEASDSELAPSHLVYPDGRIVVSRYDNLDRLVSRADSKNVGTVFEREELFDPIGTYQYIGQDRVLTLAYQNHTRLTYLDGSQDFGYDQLRRPVKIIWERFDTGQLFGGGSMIVGFGHQFAGTGSIFSRVPAYDRMNNRLIEEKFHLPGNSETYRYDSAYRLIGFERGELNDGKTDIVQFTQISNGLQKKQFILDGANNQIQVIERRNSAPELVGFVSVPTNTNEIHRQTLKDTSEERRLEFDPNGNTLNTGAAVGAVAAAVGAAARTVEWPGGGRRMRNDALNRLSRIWDTSNVTDSSRQEGTLIGVYLYDAMNRRVQKNAAGDRTIYYYDAKRVIEERNQRDQLERQFVYGNYIDEVWVMDDRLQNEDQVVPVTRLNDGTGRNRFFYHYDARYSVFALTNEGTDGDFRGVLAEGYLYDPYGRVTVIFASGNNLIITSLASVSQVGNPYQFMGRRVDPETKLNYNRNRYYDAELGRFIARDPIGYAGARLGLYEYGNSNPIMNSDAQGLYVESGWDIFSIGVGIASLSYNLYKGNWGDAALDTVGLLADTAALALPFVPGGVSVGIKAARAGGIAVDAAKAAQYTNRAVKTATYTAKGLRATDWSANTYQAYDAYQRGDVLGMAFGALHLGTSATAIARKSKRGFT